MKIVYSPRYEIDIGDHVFPTDKYRLTRELLLKEQVVTEDDFIEPPAPVIEDILLVHTREYVDDMLNLRWTRRTVRSELPLTEEIVQGFLLFASGTILASRLALEEQKCVHLGGGFHHAFSDHGEGFCYVNDIAVGIRKMLAEQRIERAAVIDCDLHQGNGTARIFAQEPRVFTFSIHQEALYPVKEQSDLDIGLDNETRDSEYLTRLEEVVPGILDRHKPQLVVYQAGSDPYMYDRLGSLRLSIAGLVKRDRIVYENCRDRKIAIVAVLGGGYALDKNDTALIHANLVKVFLERYGPGNPELSPRGPLPSPTARRGTDNPRCSAFSDPRFALGFRAGFLPSS